MDETTLKRKRGGLKASLTNFIKHVQLLPQKREGLDESEIVNLQQRLVRLESVFIQFIEVQNEIELITDETNLDEQYTERAKFDDLFYEYLAISKTLLPDDEHLDHSSNGTRYMVPVSAYTLEDGLIIAVDTSNYISNRIQHVHKNRIVDLKKKWLTSSIKNLIHHYKMHKHLFGNTSLKAWRKITNSMSEDGINFSVEQVKTKFSKLKQNYTKARNNNSQTGASPIDFLWMEEFDMIFKKNHDVSPVATASSSKFTPLQEQNGNSNSQPNIIPKKGCKNSTEKILSSLEKMQQERALRQRQREAERSDILNAYEKQQ
ncbi:unnamed protein product [Ceutorhynchus assimilis]|uniref:Myb/SANT-like DNA-binding domain-containing protein n=1 Tax=Ceutorhynchus assimilis TaxID=467358 RepID=A0A9N9N3B5_9CUCU|nr:unnamed protein product [Ceutorhynchus assimilis]